MIETPEQEAARYVCPDMSNHEYEVMCIGSRCFFYRELRHPFPPAPPGFQEPRPFACAKAIR